MEVNSALTNATLRLKTSSRIARPRTSMDPVVSFFFSLFLFGCKRYRFSIDFCLWAPASPNSTIADTEGEEVAWCTKPGHGTRLIPSTAITGLQYLKTPDYIQVVGFINQIDVNIASGDYGGELDPHGADLRGNPLGGVMFSTAWTGAYVQVIEWTKYVFSEVFISHPLKTILASWAEILSVSRLVIRPDPMLLNTASIFMTALAALTMRRTPPRTKSSNHATLIMPISLVYIHLPARL